MQSTSNTTCSLKTSLTDRATVITGSDRTGGQSGQPTATTVHTPDRASRSRSHPSRPEPPNYGDQGHASSGWGEAPLGLDGHHEGREERETFVARVDDWTPKPRQVIAGGGGLRPPSVVGEPVGRVRSPVVVVPEVAQGEDLVFVEV